MLDAEPWELCGTLTPGKRDPWVFCLGEEGDVVLTISLYPPGLRWVLLHLLLPEPDQSAVSKRRQLHDPDLLQEELDRGNSPVKGSKEPCVCPVPDVCPGSTRPAVPWAREGF